MNNDEINDTLVQWHLKRFREDEVALKEAAESLVTDEPLVELRPIEHSSRWAVRSLPYFISTRMLIL